jgi:hypothetical protein
MFRDCKKAFQWVNFHIKRNAGLGILIFDSALCRLPDPLVGVTTGHVCLYRLNTWSHF